jgi:hypothetical protein
MRKDKLIYFEWDTYIANPNKYRVATRFGKPVKQLTRFEQANDRFNIYGIVDGEVLHWSEYGVCGIFGLEHDYDLYLHYDEEIVGSWVNVYKNDGQGPIYGVGSICTTKEECLKYKRSGYITTINLNDIINELTNDK